MASTGSDASLEEAGGFWTLKREQQVELRGREEGERVGVPLKGMLGSRPSVDGFGGRRGREGGWGRGNKRQS